MKKIWAGFLSCLGLFLFVPCSAQTCNDLLSSLSPAKIEALTQASQCDYQVAILTAEIKGQNRTVVLLGECHIKSKEAHLAGQNVIKQFQFRGVEGADTDKLWGGPVFGISIELSYQMARLVSFGKRSFPSTIEEALIREHLIKAMGLVYSMIENEDLTPDELKLISFDFADRSFSFHEALKKLELSNNDPLPPFERNVHLEKNHQPGLAENLLSVFVPASFFSCIGVACSTILDFAWPGNLLSAHLTPASLAVITLNISQAVSAKAMRRWSETKLYRVVFAVHNGLLDGRDKTMARNIVQAFHQRPAQDTLLVIVGAAHLPGLERNLKAQYNFHKSDLAK